MRLRAALVSMVVGGSLFVGAAPAFAQEGTVVGAGAPDAIAERYIVVLRSAPAPQAAGRLAARYGGRVERTYRTAVPGFAASMTAPAARRLAADPAVESVQQDRRVGLTGHQPAPPSWGLDRVDQATLPLSGGYTYPSVAGSVHAYVLDTGIRASHTDFGGRVTSGYDFIDDDANADDCNGHGTHVAGTVGGSTYGVAKGVRLVSVRVLNCAGEGSYSALIAAIDWVSTQAVKPAVVNLSLGGPPSLMVDNAVRASIATGVTYVVAAGNANVDACGVTPARIPQVLTVGASDVNDARAGFSNYGSCLDLFAPGVSIRSTARSGDTATGHMSGTSMASPHVAGVAALYLAAHPGASPAQVGSAITAAARVGSVTGPGAGSVNRLLQLTPAAPSNPRVVHRPAGATPGRSRPVAATPVRVR